MTAFPALSDARRMQMFADRPGPARVLIDTDAANEIDDQFAIAWAMLSPDRIDVEAIVAEPYGHFHMREELVAAVKARQENTGTDLAEDKHESWARHLIANSIDPATMELTGPAEGMERSYQEIITVLEKMGIPASGMAYRGSGSYMPAGDTPVESEGAERIIEAALSDDERVLYVVAIGAVTNVASALLMAPEIATRMVVTWTSGYPTWTDLCNRPSLNLVQDPHASRLLFSSGVPLVYLPGFHIGAQLRFSLPEAEAWIKGRGDIGNYLFHPEEPGRQGADLGGIQPCFLPEEGHRHREVDPPQFVERVHRPCRRDQAPARARFGSARSSGGTQPPSCCSVGDGAMTQILAGSNRTETSSPSSKSLTRPGSVIASISVSPMDTLKRA